MSEENKNALDEIHKGTCMGMDAICFIQDKIEDENFKKVISNQYHEYQKIAEEIEELYARYSQKDPHKTTVMNKAMTWYGVQMKTLTDHTNSKIAELLLQGTNMGIIEGKKILNHKNLTPVVTKLINRYVDMQEESVEKLKTYL